MTAKTAYFEIIYNGPKGPIRVLPAWGQKTVPEMYFQKVGFKNLAPQKRNKLLNTDNDAEDKQLDQKRFLDHKGFNAEGVVLEENQDKIMSGASSADGLYSFGVTGVQPVNTGRAGDNSVANASTLPSKSKVCTSGVCASKADRNRLQKKS